MQSILWKYENKICNIVKILQQNVQYFESMRAKYEIIINDKYIT